MPKINIDNVNRIIEKHKSLYRDMLKKHYYPTLYKYIEELMNELSIENYSAEAIYTDSPYVHIFYDNQDYQISLPEIPYGNRNFDINDKEWKLLGYIECKKLRRKNYVKNRN